MKTEITSKISKLKATIKRPGKKQKEVWWKVTTPKPGGGRNRRFFQKETDADTYIEQQSIQLANHGTAGASMDERLRGAAIRANEILQPLGLDLVEAAKHYAKFITAQTGGIPLADAVERFKKTRAGTQYSPIYQKSLSHYLKRFNEAFPNKTSRDITPSEIDDFLNGCGAAESIKTYRKFIKALFNFLIEEGQCEKNPVRKGKTEEVAYHVEILTPQQCARLLASCDTDTLPAVAIGMFCGLRSSEIARLDWSKINLVEKVIILDTAVARKTGSRRVVPIHDSCVKWLSNYTKEAGAVQPSDFRKIFDRVRVRAGFKPSFSDRKDKDLQALLTGSQKGKVKLLPWPSNCLRHSAISYAMADCGDQSKVASWAGNSPAMIKKHYDAQATPSQAKAFYSIIPTAPYNQVDFKPAFKKPSMVKNAA
jgi:integrase